MRWVRWVRWGDSCRKATRAHTHTHAHMCTRTRALTHTPLPCSPGTCSSHPCPRQKAELGGCYLLSQGLWEGNISQCSPDDTFTLAQMVLPRPWAYFTLVTHGHGQGLAASPRSSEPVGVGPCQGSKVNPEAGSQSGPPGLALGPLHGAVGGAALRGLLAAPPWPSRWSTCHGWRALPAHLRLVCCPKQHRRQGLSYFVVTKTVCAGSGARAPRKHSESSDQRDRQIHRGGAPDGTGQSPQGWLEGPACAGWELASPGNHGHGQVVGQQTGLQPGAAPLPEPWRLTSHMSPDP